MFVYAGGHEATMRAAFVPAFEALTGATVTLFPGWWDGIAKLKTAPPNDPPFDLIISDATQGYPAAKDGLFAEIDPANIPNAKLLAPAALDNFIWKERLGVPYPDAVHTLAYFQPGVNPAPTRWADLFRDDLRGKIGLYNAFYMSLFTFAAIQADLEGKPGTAHDRIATNVGGVMKFARENRGRVKLWWPTTTDMMQALANRDCVAGNMHSPEYLAAMKEKPDFGAAVPPADRAFVQVFWSVPAGAKNKSLAETAINLMFSPDVQKAFARRGMATAIPNVAAEVAAEDAVWKSLYPHTPEHFNGVKYYPYEAYAKNWDALADEWDRTVLRAG